MDPRDQETYFKGNQLAEISAAMRSVGADGHGVVVGLADVGGLHWVDNSDDVVGAELPLADDAEEVSNDSPDGDEDVADEPVDQVTNPVSRLCHFFKIN